MPTYEYECKKCGERFDVVQSFTDDPLKRHKGCGGAVKRVFGSVGISFKGSGFYKTDNRSSSSKSESKTETKSETKTEAKSESKPDKKPDTKTSPSTAS